MGSSKSERLTAKFVRKVDEPGRYGDGGRGSFGLYLRVHRAKTGRVTKNWGQRLWINGKATNLGLGSYPVVTLAAARRAALKNRRAVYEGRDPRGSGVPTFAEAAETVIQLHAPTWKDPKTIGGQWRQSLRDYAFPIIGRKRLGKIATGDVLAVLTPIWSAKPATAKIVRRRIGAVMKWAVAKGYRQDNPAGEAIRAALPNTNGRTKHHRALPHRKIAGALVKVRRSRMAKASRLAFEFAALTACRSAEVRGAEWSEIDLGGKVWTIPADRMKAKREHRVPLSREALALLEEARALGSWTYCFPSSRTGGELSAVALRRAAKVGGEGGTVHGLRSSFRMWAGDTGVTREVAEAALAHVVGGVEGAYNRTDLFERRGAVMDAWGAYIAT